MVYGYARCSTDEQKQDISRQERDLKAMGAEQIYQEYASGTDPERSQLKKLLDEVGKGDTITATELSRITRDVHHLCHVLERAKDRRFTVKAGSLTLDASTGSIDPMVECMAIVFGAFAQLEQRQTRSRIVSGIENARAQGKPLGRPVKTLTTLPSAFLDNLGAFTLGQLTTREFEAILGVSRQTIYRWIKIFKASREDTHET